MKTTTMRAALFLAPAALALLLACKPKPVEVQPPPAQAPVSRNFTGLWEARGKSGTTYTVRFAGAEWESHIEKGGAKRPYCRGTYTFSGSVLDLRVLEEADPTTFEWVPEKGNFPKSMSGRLVGGRLQIPAITEGTELVKKN